MTTCNDAGVIAKKKLAFVYKLVRPNENEEIEYQFEELRALHYYSIYNEKKKKDEREKELTNEINQLKSQYVNHSKI